MFELVGMKEVGVGLVYSKSSFGRPLTSCGYQQFCDIGGEGP